jgi:hypothetical protein
MFQKIPDELRNKLEAIADGMNLERPTRAQLDVAAECIQYGEKPQPESRRYRQRLEYFKKHPGKHW